MRNNGLYTILCLFNFLAVSQNGVTGHPDWFIKAAFHSGFILEHRSTIGHLVKGYPAIYELDLGKPSLGNKLWQLENNLPDMGFSVCMIDFKNPSQLGYSFSLAPFIDIPLNRNRRASRVHMRLSWGVSYLSKAFDINSNHKNIAIGSKWNSFVQFKWFWQLKLARNIHFEPGFAFSHASNARAKVPNLGLNVVSLNAALRIAFPSKTAPVLKGIDSSAKVRSANEMLTYVSFGYNQREVASPPLYNFHYSIAYQRNLRNTHKFGAGADIFIDQNYLHDYQHEFGKFPEGIHMSRIALKFCYSYNVGRVSFPVEAGAYVFGPFQPDGPVVSRIGVRYYSASGIVASVGLRTHFAVAYDFEYGIGYRLFL